MRAALLLVALVFLASAHGCGVNCGCQSCLDSQGVGPGCLCSEGLSFVINEVFASEAGGWVEIVNVGQTTNLAGYTLWVDGKEVFLFGSTAVGAGQGLVVASSTKDCGFYDGHNHIDIADKTGSVVVWATPGLGISSAWLPIVLKGKGENAPETAWAGGSRQVLKVLSDIETAVKKKVPRGGESESESDEGEHHGEGGEHGWSSYTLYVDVYGEVKRHADVSNEACSPGRRSDNEFFRRLLISELLIDPGFNDANKDGDNNLPVSRPYGGLQDAFIEIVNQECYSVDISGWQLCVTCPAVCQPTVSDDDTSYTGCKRSTSPQQCTPYHLFPAGTVLNPGGAVVVFGGYNQARGGANTVSFSVDETSEFGWSQVQIASLPDGMSLGAHGDDGMSKRIAASTGTSDSLSTLLSVLPCQACNDDQACSQLDSFFLVPGSEDAPEPAVVYNLLSTNEVVNVMAAIPVLNIVPGVSFTHIPNPEQADFRYHCIGDACGEDASCSSAGYRNDGNAWSSAYVEGVRSVGNNGPLIPGSVVTVSTTLKNVGDQSAYNVIYTDDGLSRATLVAGSVRINSKVENCVVVSGNNFGDLTVQVEIPELCICSGGDIVITYDVLVDASFPCDGPTAEQNQGTISWTNGEVNSAKTRSGSTPDVNESPNLITYDLSTDLTLSSEDIPDCVAPGESFNVSFTATNNGNTQACGLSALAVSEAGLEECEISDAPETLDAQASVQFSVSCQVKQPYPDVPAVTSVLVSLQNGKSGASRSASVQACINDGFAALKVASCGPDANACCEPGDVISYTVLVVNSGNRFAKATFSELQPESSDVKLVAGSVSILYGDLESIQIVTGNSYDDETVEVSIPSLAPQDYVQIVYQWKLATPLSVSFPGSVTNQGTVEWWAGQGEKSGTALTQASQTVRDSPTVKCVTGEPVVKLEKTCSQVDEALSPEDQLLFTITVTNEGTQTAVVSLEDDFMASLVSVVMYSESGLYVDGDSQINFPDLTVDGNGGTVYVWYSVRVKASVPEGDDVLATQTQGTVYWNGQVRQIVQSNLPECAVVKARPVLTLSNRASWNQGNVAAGSDARFTAQIKNDVVGGSTQGVSSWSLELSSNDCTINNEVQVLPPTFKYTTQTNDEGALVISGESLNVGELVSVNYSCKTARVFEYNDLHVHTSAYLTYGTDGLEVSANARAPLGSSVELKLDATCADRASPSSPVPISITISNTGNRQASDVKLVDVLTSPQLLTPRNCSNPANLISIKRGEDVDTVCDYESLIGSGLSLGDIKVGECVTVSYTLWVACPVAYNAPALQNSFDVFYRDETVQQSDLCKTAGLGVVQDSCSVPLGGLNSWVSAVTFTKLGQQNSVSPTGFIDYVLTVSNFGNVNTNNFVVVDNPSRTEPKNYVALLPGSVNIAEESSQYGCIVQNGNRVGDDSLKVVCPTLPGSCGTENVEALVIHFTATLKNGLPHKQKACNQASLTFDGKPEILSDNPLTPVLSDPSCFDINYNPLFSFNTQCNPDKPTVGDTIQCETVVTLVGTEPGNNLIYDADFDQNLLLTPGSVVFNQAPSCASGCPNDPKLSICQGNFVNNNKIRVFAGDLVNKGDSFRVAFKAQVRSPFQPTSSLAPETSFVSTIYGAAVEDVPTCSVGPVYDQSTNTIMLDQQGISAQIAVTKTASLASAQGVRPGQRIQYTVSISNLGNAVGDVNFADILVGEDFGPDCIGPALNLLPGTVDSNRGVVTVGNKPLDQNVQVNVGPIAPFESATIIFEAVVANPFPCRALEVVNQAVVTDEFSGAVTPSDDPNTAPIGDATATPVDAAPLVSAFKGVRVKGIPFGSTDSPVANPGDTLEYTLTIVNSGNQAAFQVTVTDQLDRSASLDPTSMKLNGEAVKPEDITDVDTNARATFSTRTFQINIGAVAGQKTSILEFNAVVSETLTSSIITNQAIIDGQNFDEVLSSAPDSGLSDLATSIEVSALPLIDSLLEWSYQGSTDITPAPGDVIEYTVSVSNLPQATATASNVLISVNLPSPLLTLNRGTVTSNDHGVTVRQGNSLRDSNVLVSVAEIPKGSNITFTFAATLASIFPAHVNSVTVQAHITGDNFNPALSRDPSSAILDDPTVTAVAAKADVEVAVMSLFKGQDVSSANPITVGGTFQGVVTLINKGDQPAVGVRVTLPIDENAAFIAGSVLTDCSTACRVTTGNYVGNSGPVVVTIASLEPGTDYSYTITYSATVSSPFAGQSASVWVEYKVSGDNIGDINDQSSFPVNAVPQLQVSMTCDFCLSTGSICSSLNPGDGIQATVTITNVGNQNAQDLYFLNDPSSPFVSSGGPTNFVPTSAATGTQFENPSNGSLIVTIPSLAGNGGSVSFSYNLLMTTATPTGTTQKLSVWSNDGLAQFSGVFSCSSSSSSSSTSRRDAPIEIAPRQFENCPGSFSPCSGSGFHVNSVNSCGSVTATLSQDVDGNGVVSTNDVLLYTTTLFIQSTCSDLSGVSFTNILDAANVKLVQGSVRTTLGRIVSGNSQNDAEVYLYMGNLPGKRQIEVVISFEALVIGFSETPKVISNTAFVTIASYGTYNIADIDPEVSFVTDVSAFSSASAFSVSFFTVCFAFFSLFFVR